MHPPPEYGTVTAEDIIPKKVPIKNASHTIKKGNGVYQGTISDYFEIYYEVTFDEFPEKNNYYLAKITQIKTGYYGYYETEIDYIDPVFKNRMPYWTKVWHSTDWKKEEEPSLPTKALTDKPILYK